MEMKVRNISNVGTVVPRPGTVSSDVLSNLYTLEFDPAREDYLVLRDLTTPGDGCGGVFLIVHEAQDDTEPDGYDVVALGQEYAGWKLLRVGHFAAGAQISLSAPQVISFGKTAEPVVVDQGLVINCWGPWAKPVSGLGWLGQDASLAISYTLNIRGTAGDRLQAGLVEETVTEIPNSNPNIALDSEGYGSLNLPCAFVPCARGTSFKLLIQNMTAPQDIELLAVMVCVVRRPKTIVL